MYSEHIKKTNPKKGYYLEYFNTQFPYITDRARKILKHRTKDEIIEAVKILDKLIFGHTEEAKKFQVERLINEALQVENEINEEDSPSTTSPAAQLAHYIENTEFAADPKFNNASLEEYFAALTLGIVGEAYQEQEKIKKNNCQVDKKCWFTMGHYAVEAMEAVAYGESLIMQKRAKQRAHQEEQEKRSSVAKKAGDKSHEKTNTLLKMLHDFYLENNHTKYSTAVHEFLSVTDEKYFKHLAPTNRPRTLSEALSKIVRGKRALD